MSESEVMKLTIREIGFLHSLCRFLVLQEGDAHKLFQKYLDQKGKRLRYRLELIKLQNVLSLNGKLGLYYSELRLYQVAIELKKKGFVIGNCLLHELKRFKKI